MDIMLDSALVRKLRTERSWSQDQLADAAGLSLRTVQRIEKDGTCSLESSQALAAVFETRVASIQLDTDKEIRESRIRRFQFWGSFGNTAGVICAFAGISYSFYIGNLQGLEAGLWYSGIAVLSGLLHLANLLLSAYFRNSRIF